jgi:hypothetical protein
MFWDPHRRRFRAYRRFVPVSNIFHTLSLKQSKPSSLEGDRNSTCTIIRWISKHQFKHFIQSMNIMRVWWICSWNLWSTIQYELLWQGTHKVSHRLPTQKWIPKSRWDKSTLLQHKDRLATEIWSCSMSNSDFQVSVYIFVFFLVLQALELTYNINIWTGYYYKKAIRIIIRYFRCQ